MIRRLKQNERLAYAGEAVLRTAGGSPFDSIPQYIIVSGSVDSVAIPLRKNEQLTMIGTLHTGREAAEARFAAMLEGRAQPQADGIPLYAKETVESADKTNGLSADERKICDSLVDELIAVFSMQKDQIEATRAALATH